MTDKLAVLNELRMYEKKGYKLSKYFTIDSDVNEMTHELECMEEKIESKRLYVQILLLAYLTNTDVIVNEDSMMDDMLQEYNKLCKLRVMTA